MVAEQDDPEETQSLVIQCPVLLTDRLVLRPPHLEDVVDLVALANDPQLASMLTTMPHPYREADAQAFVARWAVAESGAAYALTDAETGAFLGCASLIARNEGAELGYWIGKPFQGFGYATEAAHALVDLAFRASNLDRLHASCRVINAASRRVIQKCGFDYVGPGMTRSRVAGQVAVDRFKLDRKTWIALRSWPRSD